MILKQFPRSGDWKVIAASLVALSVAGCANLGTAPDSTEGAEIVVATPVLAQDLESGATASQQQVVEDSSAAGAAETTELEQDIETVAEQAPEFSAAELALLASPALDIEAQAASGTGFEETAAGRSRGRRRHRGFAAGHP